MKEIMMLITAMALAGSSVVVGKILTEAAPFFFATFDSLLVALLCMLPLMRKRWHEIRRLDSLQYRYLFLQGLCGIVLFRVFILYGLRSTSAVEAGIITGTTPAILVILSFFMLQEPLSLRSCTGVISAASGCILINLLAESGGRESTFLGCLLVLAAVVCEALFTIFRKRICDTVSATTNTTVLLACSLLLVLPMAIYDWCRMDHLPDAEVFIGILYYGIFATVLAYLLWTKNVGKVSGAVAGAATAAMPASSLLLGVAILGEHLQWIHLVGCALIIAGIFITSGKAEPGSAINGTS